MCMLVCVFLECVAAYFHGHWAFYKGARTLQARPDCICSQTLQQELTWLDDGDYYYFLTHTINSHTYTHCSNARQLLTRIPLKQMSVTIAHTYSAQTNVCYTGISQAFAAIVAPNTQMHTHAYTSAHTNKHTHKTTRKQQNTHTHTHIHTRAHTHKCTHTLTHIHTHECAYKQTYTPVCCAGLPGTPASAASPATAFWQSPLLPHHSLHSVGGKRSLQEECVWRMRIGGTRPLQSVHCNLQCVWGVRMRSAYWRKAFIAMCSLQSVHCKALIAKRSLQCVWGVRMRSCIGGKHSLQAYNNMMGKSQGTQSHWVNRKELNHILILTEHSWACYTIQATSCRSQKR
jgi:hypothetical protein